MSAFTDAELETLESVRSEPAVGQPAPSPLCFDENYVLPVHRDKCLQMKHSYKRDEDIQFFEEPHVYVVFKKPCGASVSGLLKIHETIFDAPGTVYRMKHGANGKPPPQKWPRLEYVHGPEKIDRVDQFVPWRGHLIYNTHRQKTVASLPALTVQPEGVHPSFGGSEQPLKRQLDEEVDGIFIHTMLADSQTAPREEDHEEWYSYSRAMTPDEIVAMWNANGLLARNQGTEAHLQMELWLNSEPTRADCPELQMGLRFLLDYLVPHGDRAFATEKEIFGEEEDIAGTIDFVARTTEDHVILVDWKRSKKLSGDMTGYKKLAAPLDHLDDCHGAKYAIQLSGYQYLFEKYYGETVDDRILVSIYPDDPFVFSVPYLKDEIEYLMACRQEETKARNMLEATHPSLCCSESGRLATEAVRDEHGHLWHQKMAAVRQINATADDRTSQAASALLKEQTKVVEYTGRKIPWRTQYANHCSTTLPGSRVRTRESNPPPRKTAC